MPEKTFRGAERSSLWWVRPKTCRYRLKRLHWYGIGFGLEKERDQVYRGDTSEQIRGGEWDPPSEAGSW